MIEVIGWRLPAFFFLFALLLDAAQANDLEKELIQAAVAGNITEVVSLLDAGANVNTRNEIGKTALMYAAEEGHNEVVELLIPAVPTWMRRPIRAARRCNLRPRAAGSQWSES